MYDREPRFEMHETRNAAILQFMEKGVMHFASRRCEIMRISQSGAVLAINTKFKIPHQFNIDIPDARLRKIGAILMKTFPNNAIEVRFLRLLDKKELNRVFVYSTHPAHRNAILDVRA